MTENKLPWFMRLTIQNSDTGKSAFAMYPCDKYEALESLDSCGIPYGGGNYRHLAESYNRVEADSLQRALAGVIEHRERPPSVAELNRLGGQIQSMTDEGRLQMEREICEAESPAIADAIHAASRVLGESMAYDGEALSGRAVLLGENEPYARVMLFNGGSPDEATTEENTLWADCPVSQSDLEAAALKLGAASVGDIEIYGAVSILSDKMEDLINDYSTIGEINRFAEALRTNNVAESLAKYKSILQTELCYDIGEATELAASLDDYEFFQGETPEEAGNRFREQYGHELGGGEIAEDMGFEESSYGAIRKAEGPEPVQSMDFS